MGGAVQGAGAIRPGTGWVLQATGSESLIHVFLAWAGGSPPSEPHLGYV